MVRIKNHGWRSLEAENMANSVFSVWMFVFLCFCCVLGKLPPSRPLSRVSLSPLARLHRILTPVWMRIEAMLEVCREVCRDVAIPPAVVHFLRVWVFARFGVS